MVRTKQRSRSQRVPMLMLNANPVTTPPHPVTPPPPPVITLNMKFWKFLNHWFHPRNVVVGGWMAGVLVVVVSGWMAEVLVLFQHIGSTVKHSTFPCITTVPPEWRRFFLELWCQCQPTANPRKIAGIVSSGEISEVSTIHLLYYHQCDRVKSVRYSYYTTISAI